MFNSWIALSLNAARLGWEAQNVIALRLMRMATGRIGPTEAGLMITEKIAAATEAQAVATTFPCPSRKSCGHDLYANRGRGIQFSDTRSAHEPDQA
jgi:hypothetical protein